MGYEERGYQCDWLCRLCVYTDLYEFVWFVVFIDVNGGWVWVFCREVFIQKLFFFFFVLNFEIYVKVFKVFFDEICQFVFFVSYRKDVNMEGEQFFLEGGVCLWKYFGIWGIKFWVLVLETYF